MRFFQIKLTIDMDLELLGGIFGDTVEGLTNVGAHVHPGTSKSK